MADDNDTPGRKTRVDISDIRHAIRDADTPVLDVGEVANAVGMTRAGLNYRMDEILNDDYIRSKEVSNTRVFWHQNLEAKQTWATIGSNETTEEQLVQEIDPTKGIPAIDDLDLPGEGKALLLQRTAIFIAYSLICLNGKMKSSDLKDLLWTFPFTQAYSSKDGFWNNVISPSLSKFDNDIFFERKDNAWYSYSGRKKRLGISDE